MEKNVETAGGIYSRIEDLGCREFSVWVLSGFLG